MVPSVPQQSEAQTRELIDEKLKLAGWVVQDKKRMNLFESLGVAVREMDTDTGPADYMLFIEGKACGIIEAKREGTDLGGVAEQSARYATSHSKHIERWAPANQPLPFLYEATNNEIRFRDERDPHPRSRFVFHFHKPETLNSPLIMDMLLSKVAGVAITRQTFTKLNDGFITLPPAEEQKVIVRIVEEKLSSIEHLDLELNQLLIKAEKNKQSVLAFAFSGRLK